MKYTVTLKRRQSQEPTENGPAPLQCFLQRWWIPIQMIMTKIGA